MGRDWDCTAYGPEGRDVGALCFFATGCGSLVECRERMDAERRRVFGVIREKAASGDPVFEFLAGQFTSPDQILNADPDEGEG